MFPHEPQLAGSNCVSLHTPLHSVSELGQPELPHELFTHLPVAQTIPQPPQLSGSFDASTHSPPPQLIIGAAHVQAPLTHEVPPVHVIPQPPQSSGSVSGSMQALAQSASGLVQLSAHEPLSQT